MKTPRNFISSRPSNYSVLNFLDFRKVKIVFGNSEFQNGSSSKVLLKSEFLHPVSQEILAMLNLREVRFSC